jgi:nucleotide-binding universal stress UspA family protein
MHERAFASAAPAAPQPVHALRSLLAVVEFDRYARESLSAASRSALRHAAALACPEHGRVTVLHVLPPQPRALVFDREGAHAAPTGADRVADRLARAVAAERTGATIDTRIATGNSLDQIIRVATDIEAGAIVAGYQDRPGAYSDGFSFRALLHRATCPVLVTRATDAEHFGWTS